MRVFLAVLAWIALSWAVEARGQQEGEEDSVVPQEAAAGEAALEDQATPEEQTAPEPVPDDDTAPDEEIAGQAAAEPEADERRRRGVRRLGDVVGEGGDEWSLDIPALDVPLQPLELQPEVSLPDPEQDALLQNLLARRAFAPDDPGIAEELEALFDDVAEQAQAELEDGDLEAAGRLADVIAILDEDRPVVIEIRAEQERVEQRDQLLASADQALAGGRLIAPEGESALELYRAALQLEPGLEAAGQGLVNVQQALLEQALEAARELDFEAADALLDEAAAVREEPELIAETRSGIREFREREIENLIGGVRSYIDDLEYEEAEEGITQLVALGASREEIGALRGYLDDVRTYGGFEPGQVFEDPLGADGLSGPEMVVVPAGSFLMGSPDNERDRASNEGPRFRVTFERGFALSRSEVSVAEFRRFIEDTGYVTDAERDGGSRTYNADTGRIDPRSGMNWRHDYMGRTAADDLPVIHVSWNDASAYAQWLSERTGRPYRLPSEAEFEYALRAGSQSTYWWGDGSPDEPVENVTGDGDRSTTRRSWTVAFRRYDSGFWGPAPVASLRANPFGLHDMGGNVTEWVEDCWHDSYVRAPNDGSAWVNPGCDRRVLRGGNWSSTPAMSRSAYRISSTPDATDARVGFRVARDL